MKPLFGVEPMSEHISRMSVINNLAIKSRDLLYQYNKEKLNNFMDQIENLLIVENFLYMQGLFGEPQEESKVSKKRSHEVTIFEQNLHDDHQNQVDLVKKCEIKREFKSALH